jgi:hypothetical protein
VKILTNSSSYHARKILAIDPGDVESAFVILDENLIPVEFGKIPNIELLASIKKLYRKYLFEHVAIEMIASYGMAVGKTVFETCVWIGRFVQMIIFEAETKPEYVYRKDEKINLCGSMKAKDSNIRQALIDRFAKHDFKNGKGNKKNPDVFYGFKADIWAAMAVGVTYYDMHLKEGE